MANTPKLLPVLAQAGKVDSGGKGLFFILEGMLRALTGEQAPAEARRLPTALAQAVAPQPSKGQREIPSLIYGFDVQFLVEGAALDVAAIRERITALGATVLWSRAMRRWSRCMSMCPIPASCSVTR